MRERMRKVRMVMGMRMDDRQYILTHWGQDKMAAISQTTFSNAFSWMKTFKFQLQFHWSLFPRVQMTIFQTCQPLRILRNHYAFRVSNTPLPKPVENVGKLRILRNFGAIRPIPRTLQQLSWLAVSRKSPAGQNIDKDLFILRLPSHRRQISPSDQQRKLQREVKPCPMKRSADREPF